MRGRNNRLHLVAVGACATLLLLFIFHRPETVNDVVSKLSFGNFGGGGGGGNGESMDMLWLKCLYRLGADRAALRIMLLRDSLVEMVAFYKRVLPTRNLMENVNHIAIFAKDASSFADFLVKWMASIRFLFGLNSRLHYIRIIN